MSAQHSSETANDLITELGDKYVWWEPANEGPHSEERILAQAMNLGTYDDIRRLERILGYERLAQIMLEAQPGWFSDRSWEFWRGRLSLELGRALPDEPPRRSFNTAACVDRRGDILPVACSTPAGPPDRPAANAVAPRPRRLPRCRRRRA